MYLRPAHHTVPSVVGKPELIGCDYRVTLTASAFPRHAAHLEKVREVGAKVDGEADFDRSQTVVDKFERLKASRLPQQLGPRDVQSSSWQHQLPDPINIRIGQIHHEEQIVFLNFRIEQKWSTIAQLKDQARKKPRSFVIDTLLAGAGCLNVAVAVKHRESVAVFEHTADVIGSRIRGEYIECIFDLACGSLHKNYPKPCENRLKVERVIQAFCLF